MKNQAINFTSAVMPDERSFSIIVSINDSGTRLDIFLSSVVSGISRSAASNLIRKGNVTVNGAGVKPGYRLKSHDEISCFIPPPESATFKPESIDFNILHEDKHVIIVNKPPGLVVHPAPGHYRGTLVNALLYHCPSLRGVGGELRSGIVHRLDKDTSGVMVVAKNQIAHNHLSMQFKQRRIQKDYLAVVYGEMESESGVISFSIGRHPVDRKRMSVSSLKGRRAKTLWRVLERFETMTLIELRLKTGRTHQIRVHCLAINHPVAGDPVYCKRRKRKKFFGADSPVRSVSRQMLHAWRLGFTHPVTKKHCFFEAPVPLDMEKLLKELRSACKKRE